MRKQTTVFMFIEGSKGQDICLGCLQTTSFIINICDPRAPIHSNLHDTLNRSNLNRNPFAI